MAKNLDDFSTRCTMSNVAPKKGDNSLLINECSGVADKKQLDRQEPTAEPMEKTKSKTMPRCPNCSSSALYPEKGDCYFCGKCERIFPRAQAVV